MESFGRPKCGRLAAGEFPQKIQNFRHHPKKSSVSLFVYLSVFQQHRIRYEKPVSNRRMVSNFLEEILIFFPWETTVRVRVWDETGMSWASFESAASSSLPPSLLPYDWS
jgi:hypothetical protein